MFAIVLCFLVICFIGWSSLSRSEQAAAQPITSQPSSKELTEVRQLLNNQQNQISMLQEGVQKQQQAMEELTNPQFDSLHLLLQELDQWIKELHQKLDKAENRVDLAHREADSNLQELQNLVLQNLSDLEQLEYTIADIMKTIDITKNNEDQQARTQEPSSLKPSPAPLTPMQDEHEKPVGTGDVYVVIIDFGAFLDIYERRRSKIVPCSSSAAVGLPSVEKIYASIDSLQQIQQNNRNTSFTILLSTTAARKDYFDDIHDIEIVVSSTGTK